MYPNQPFFVDLQETSRSLDETRTDRTTELIRPELKEADEDLEVFSVLVVLPNQALLFLARSFLSDVQPACWPDQS